MCGFSVNVNTKFSFRLEMIVSRIHDAPNSIDPNIQLIIEYENDDKFAFLDTII